MNDMECRINDSFADNFGRKPSKYEIIKIANRLPEDIIKLAEMWGWDDTEVREFVTRWISDNISK